MLKMFGPEMRFIVVFLGLLFAGSYAMSADGDKVTGALSFSPIDTLSKDAMAEVSLVDVSLADAPGKTITSVSMPAGEEGKLKYQLNYNPKNIDPRHSYAVQARIVDGGKLVFISTTAHLVLTQGFADSADIDLKPLHVNSTGSVTGIYGGKWLVEDIDQTGVIDFARSTLAVNTSGGVSGSGACNRFQGSAEISGNSVKFGPMAMTRKMCPPAVMDQESKYMKALSGARTFKIEGAFLRFYDGAGKAVLRLTRL